MPEANSTQPTPDPNCVELMAALNAELASCNFDEMFVVVRKTGEDLDYAAYFTPNDDAFSMAGFAQAILNARTLKMVGNLTPTGDDDER